MSARILPQGFARFDHQLRAAQTRQFFEGGQLVLRPPSPGHVVEELAGLHYIESIRQPAPFVDECHTSFLLGIVAALNSCSRQPPARCGECS